MSAARYSTLHITNSGSASMGVYVTDPDGKEHFIMTLAAGAETTQFTPVGATWQLKVVDDMAAASKPLSAAISAVGPLDLDEGGKGEHSPGN